MNITIQIQVAGPGQVIVVNASGPPEEAEKIARAAQAALAALGITIQVPQPPPPEKLPAASPPGSN